jgi:hypothetical protein
VGIMTCHDVIMSVVLKVQIQKNKIWCWYGMVAVLYVYVHTTIAAVGAMNQDDFDKDD